MSQPAPKVRKSKRDAPPEVIVQEAVPLTSPNTEPEVPPMERLSSMPVTPEALPEGMKPETRLAREQQIHLSRLAMSKAEQEETTVRVLKIGALAAGVGLGILLCTKGYRYVFPAVDKAIETIVEETPQ